MKQLKEYMLIYTSYIIYASEISFGCLCLLVMHDQMHENYTFKVNFNGVNIRAHQIKDRYRDKK